MPELIEKRELRLLVLALFFFVFARRKVDGRGGAVGSLPRPLSVFWKGALGKLFKNHPRKNPRAAFRSGVKGPAAGRGLAVT